MVLVFSGGTFLFVATGAMGSNEEEEGAGREEHIGKKTRCALVVLGMILPGLLSRIVGHGH